MSRCYYGSLFLTLLFCIVTSYADISSRNVVNGVTDDQLTTPAPPSDAAQVKEELTQPKTNSATPQQENKPAENESFNAAKEGYSQQRVNQNRKKFTKEQLQLYFEAIKDALFGPSEFSDQLIENLRMIPVNNIKLETSRHKLTQALRYSLVEESKAGFEYDMKTMPEMEQAINNYYTMLIDAIENWSISDRVLNKTIEAITKLQRAEISKLHFKQEIKNLLGEEVVKDEKSFMQGDISAFLENAELV